MNTSVTTTEAETSVARWTRGQILLHWIVVGLLAVQFAIGGWMSELFQATVGGEQPDVTASVMGPIHATVGALVFLAVIARLLERRTHGRPPHPPGEPLWAQRLAAITQTLLYVTVLAMPVAGLVAWFAKDESLASLHSLAAKALFALIGLHAAGALANHYLFKTDVLRRMLPGQGRDVTRRPGVKRPRQSETPRD